ncbi:hypothetical protein BJX99DRAFT_256904 [Aspergillus californicus]
MGKRGVFEQLMFPFVLQLLATVVFVLTAWIAQTTHSTTVTIGRFTLDSSWTLALLSVFQGLLSTILTVVLSSLFELIHWTMTARRDGVRSISLLGLSPTTGALGSLRIIFSKRCRLVDRLWPLLRLALTAVLWVSGIILFANTNIGVVYKPVFDYQATAGVGQFNGSYVSEYIGNLQNREAGYPYTVVPYWMQAIVNNLVTSPMHAVASIPVPDAACAGHHCDSYLLPGGLINTSPWPPTDHPSAPVIEITNAPSIQLDFLREVNQQDSFSDEDCSIYGSETSWVGMRFCVAKSQTLNGSFAAGLYVCPGGAWNGTCEISDSPFYPNLTTTFSIYTRQTTFIVARDNLTIISVTSASPATQISTLDLENFRAAITWILDFNAANIPSPTSIAQQFYSGSQQLQNTYWSPILLQTFHSILSFPFWFFNPNNLGNMEGFGTGITPNLPTEFYITASIAVPQSKIIISTAMFSTFITLQVILHLFIWAVLVWLCATRPVLPAISSYPLFDFAFKARFKRDTKGGAGNSKDQLYHLLSSGVSPAGVLGAGDGDVLSALENCSHTICERNEVLPLTGDQDRSQDRL